MRALILVLLTILALANAIMVFVNETRDWADARYQCRTYYNIMGQPDPKTTQYGHSGLAWIGGNRLHDLVSPITYWKWENSSNPVIDYRWLDGRPDNHGRLRFCMAITNKNKMVDTPCFERLPFYCGNEWALSK